MYIILEFEFLCGLVAACVAIVHLLPAAGPDISYVGIFMPDFGEGIRVQIFCIMSGFVIFRIPQRSQESLLPRIRRRLRADGGAS